jgi:transglutaminase-like putative cysteine protease
VSTQSSARYRVRHETRYEYLWSAAACTNLLHLRPRNDFRQRVTQFRLVVTPEPAAINAWDDAFGNPTHYIEVHRSHKVLSLLAESDVLVEPVMAPIEGKLLGDKLSDRLRSDRHPTWIDAYRYCFPSPRLAWSADVGAFAASSFGKNRPVRDAVLEWMQRVHDGWKYDPNATHVHTTVDEVFRDRRGVCQDLAHLCIAGLRAQGLAARYCSGYLRTVPPPGRPRLIGADASHAWISVFLGTQWWDLDPTNNCPVGTDHVLVARGRDYGDVAPVLGFAAGGGKHQLFVGVDVEPLPHS